ncbi:hypothetical protein BKA93DRAFT_596221 [Sparassis latifolia]
MIHQPKFALLTRASIFVSQGVAQVRGTDRSRMQRPAQFGTRWYDRPGNRLGVVQVHRPLREGKADVGGLDNQTFEIGFYNFLYLERGILQAFVKFGHNHLVLLGALEGVAAEA